MRPSGRSRGSVPGRKNVTTLNRIVPLWIRVARQQCIDPPCQPTAEWFEPTADGTSGLRAGTSHGMLSPEAAARHISEGGRKWVGSDRRVTRRNQPRERDFWIGERCSPPELP